MTFLNIADIDLINNLRDVKLHDVEIGGEIIADTWKGILPGDKLCTDEDWLDAEFLPDKAKYRGEPRDPDQFTSTKTEEDRGGISCGARNNLSWNGWQKEGRREI